MTADIKKAGGMTEMTITGLSRTLHPGQVKQVVRLLGILQAHLEHAGSSKRSVRTAGRQKR